MLPRDSADARPAMLEIRAGTGGDEAALFAADLFRMYEGYAAEQGWKVETVSLNANELGGFKEIVAQINGTGVFAKLKFESGVHRVQRVPVTESGGRIHTSAATVAVLPEPTEVDVQIEDKDLRIDIYRAQRRRRAARQQDRFRGAPDPLADRHRRGDAGRAQPAPQPRQGDGCAARADLREDAQRGPRRRGRGAQGDGRLAATAPSASAPTTSRKAG